MSIIFEKTAKQLADEKILYIIVTLIVSAVFGSLFFLVDEERLVWPVIAGIVFALFICVIIIVALFRETIAILKDGRTWKVEITSDRITWFSPLPKQMESFEAEFSEISYVQQKLVHYRGSKKSSKNYFYINFTNGRSLEIKAQMCGFNPVKIFKALEKQGVNFEFTQERKGSPIVLSTS